MTKTGGVAIDIVVRGRFNLLADCGGIGFLHESDLDKGSLMKVRQSILFVLALMLLSACGPSEQQKAKLAEQKRLECLDKFCPGDVEPKRDVRTEVALKLNGQWFIGPSEYFSSGINGAAFEWWNHEPLSRNMKRPPEAQALAVAGKGYDFSIEIFLRRHDGILQRPSQYESLRAAAAEGRLVGKEQLRPGLERWRVKAQGGLPGVWYVATDLKSYDGNSPVLWCSEHDVKADFCTTGFIWRPGIAGDMRFHAKHGPDWLEIFHEATRILQLLRKT